jgi:GNAT superfamily N-acetyltransferase
MAVSTVAQGERIGGPRGRGGAAMSPVEIRPAADESDIEAVRSLWREYWASEGFADDFQGFAEELRSLPGDYGPPRGLLLLALIDGAPSGAIALRTLSENACEAKRLYVRPRFRGQGVGQALLEQLIERARSKGYKALYGDTLPSMHAALRMYKSRGFERTEPYSPHPTPGAVYLKLHL